MLRINNLRRKITHFFTKNLVKNKYIYEDYSNIKNILIIRPNHRLGNILLLTPLIEEIKLQFPNASINLFVKGGISNILFENDNSINSILSLPKNHFKEIITYIITWSKLSTKRYDLVINPEAKSSSGRIATRIVRSKYKFIGVDNNKNIFSSKYDYLHFAKKPIYNLWAYLLQTNTNLITSSIPQLTLKLTEKEKEIGVDLIKSITKNDKKTICFFTYATGLKCHSNLFWEELYSKLNNEFKDEYNLIEILPLENISQIGFKEKSYYSKNIREIASFLYHTEIFIGADSGMMHLASTATKTIGLFNVTSKDKYGPYGKYNTAINTNATSIDEIISIIKSTLLL